MSIVLLTKDKVKTRCIHQGRLFIRHFIQAIDLNVESNEFDINCKILQLMFNSVKDLLVDFSLISNQQFFKWFFLLDDNVDSLINKNLQNLYLNFSLDLLNNKHKSVKAVLLNNLE